MNFKSNSAMLSRVLLSPNFYGRDLSPLLSLIFKVEIGSNPQKLVECNSTPKYAQNFLTIIYSV